MPERTPPRTPTRPAAQPSTDAVRLVPASRIQGTREAVAEILRRHHATGRLVEFTQPRPVPDRPGEVWISVRLMPDRQPTQPPPRQRRRVGPYLLAASVLAVVAGLAWLVYLAVTWIAANIAIVVAGLAVVLVLAIVGGQRACETVITITHRH